LQNRLRVFFARNYTAKKVRRSIYLAVTKPGRALLETLKGRPRTGWAILSGTIAGLSARKQKIARERGRPGEVIVLPNAFNGALP
jgi:hypothetical protein